MRRYRAAVFVCAVASVLLPAAPASAGTGDIEAHLLEDINIGRGKAGEGALVLHSGLSNRAYQHSVDMAEDGELNHDGSSDRPRTASPDPSEHDGAPDDGFSLYGACENVAYRRGPDAPAADIAAAIYTAWRESDGHRECMFDESHAHTVTGVGVFRGPDDTSWATFLAVDDRTLPEVSHEREADSKPEPKPPVFAKDDPCGETVEGSVFGGATVVKFAAADPDRDRVSMTATGLPSWASFTSTSGKKGRGTLRVAPTITHWLNSAFSRPHKAVVTARDVTGEKTRCVFSLRPTLL